MYDYKVIAGRYSVDGADVTIENPLGRSTLQRVLDHYGAEGFDLVSAHYDGINREAVLLMKRIKGGVAPVQLVAPAAAAAAAAPAAGRGRAAPPPEEPAAGGRRRSKADLDKLARD